MVLKVVNVSKGEKVRLFNTIFVETGAKCNRTCVFCPNHSTVRPDEYMSWSMITKIVKELQDLDYKGRFSPYIYNEPMQDPRFYDICRYVHESLPSVRISVNTNSDFIRGPAEIEACFEVGVVQLMLNVYSQSDGCGDKEREERGVRTATKRADQLQAWLDTLSSVDQESTLYGSVKRGSRVARVVRKFGVEGDGTNFGGGFELQNRSGNIDWFMDTVPALEKHCVRPFRTLNVDWKGNGVLCCNDYHSVTAFGNVRNKSLVEIWNAEGFHKYRLFLQNRDRRIGLCATCDFGGGAYPHMVDHVTFGSDEKDQKILGR